MISNNNRLELYGCNLPLQVQGVIAKSIDVLDPVGSQAAQNSRVNDKSLGLNLLEHPGHRLHVVQDDQVGDQLVVLDDLALLVPHVLGDDALAAEEQPLRELVELLALAGRGSTPKPSEFPASACQFLNALGKVSERFFDVL